MRTVLEIIFVRKHFREFSAGVEMRPLVFNEGTGLTSGLYQQLPCDHITKNESKLGEPVCVNEMW